MADVTAALQRHYPADNPLTEEVVRRWKRGKATPPLALLPAISEVLFAEGAPEEKGSAAAQQLGLGHHPNLVLLLQMGILPEQPPVEALVDRAYRLEKLEVKIAEAQDAAAAAAMSRGASTLMQAALGTGRWAVAVWPAVEGPDDCRMRVADRIDFRHVDGGALDADTVWREPDLKAALRAAFAVREERSPRRPAPENSVSRWAIPHIARPSSPTLLHHHPGFTGVSFTSLTVHSRVNDIASLTAMVLGYGFTMTRDLAVETTGRPHDQTPEEERRAIHAGLLAQPPRRRVWSHHAGLGEAKASPFRHQGTQAGLGVFHVRVREGDRLLELVTSQDGEDLDRYADRQYLDRLATNLPPGALLQVEVHGDGSNADRWTEVLETVNLVVWAMHERGLLNDLRDVHTRLRERSPHVGAPVLAWLRKRGCPAVTS